jgi:hypothetical protein
LSIRYIAMNVTAVPPITSTCPFNGVTPPSKELKTLGLVREVRRRPCRHSGNKANVLEAVPQRAEQLSLLAPN